MPVWKELLVDQETPVSAYERVRSYLRERDDASHTFFRTPDLGCFNLIPFCRPSVGLCRDSRFGFR